MGTACYRDSETRKGKGFKESQVVWWGNRVQKCVCKSHGSRNVCANLGRIHFIISPVGTGWWVWIILERAINPRVQSLNLIQGAVGDIEGA